MSSHNTLECVRHVPCSCWMWHNTYHFAFRSRKYGKIYSLVLVNFIIYRVLKSYFTEKILLAHVFSIRIIRIGYNRLICNDHYLVIARPLIFSVSVQAAAVGICYMWIDFWKISRLVCFDRLFLTVFVIVTAGNLDSYLCKLQSESDSVFCMIANLSESWQFENVRETSVDLPFLRGLRALQQLFVICGGFQEWHVLLFEERV